jgi:hypothetical protein
MSPGRGEGRGGWIRLAMRQGLGREIAFALLRRAGPAG